MYLWRKLSPSRLFARELIGGPGREQANRRSRAIWSEKYRTQSHVTTNYYCKSQSDLLIIFCDLVFNDRLFFVDLAKKLNFCVYSSEKPWGTCWIRLNTTCKLLTSARVNWLLIESVFRNAKNNLYTLAMSRHKSKRKSAYEI